jgi:hypothetical protein
MQLYLFWQKKLTFMFIDNIYVPKLIMYKNTLIDTRFHNIQLYTFDIDEIWYEKYWTVNKINIDLFKSANFEPHWIDYHIYIIILLSKLNFSNIHYEVASQATKHLEKHPCIVRKVFRHHKVLKEPFMALHIYCAIYLHKL